MAIFDLCVRDSGFYEIRLNALPDFRFEVKQRHFSVDSLAEHVLHFTN